MNVRALAVSGTLFALTAGAVLPAAGQSIDEIERVGGGGGTPPQAEVFATSATGVRGVDGGMSLVGVNRLTMYYPWLLHVWLVGPAEEGLVTLGSDVMMSNATVVSDAGDGPGDFTIETGCGGQRIAVNRGALALANWPGRSCHVAAGAHLNTLGTSYAVQVGGDGYALLAVTEDSVAIHWWGGQGEADQQTPCVGGQTQPCLATALEGSLWRWSVTDPPVEVGERDDFVLAGWDDAVNYMVDDAWKDSIFKSPYFWGGVGAAGILLCVLWLCQGDDVTGTVIINPTY